MVCQWSRGSMPVRSCRQPWGMKSPKRMRGTLPARRRSRAVRSNRCIRTSPHAPSCECAPTRQDEERAADLDLRAGAGGGRTAAGARRPADGTGRVRPARARGRGAARAARHGRGRAGRRPGGSGNNGGDALFAGALLARRGVEVRAVLTGAARPRGWPGGAAAGRGPCAARRRSVDDAAALAAGADLVLDGLLGIGADGSGLRGVARRARARRSWTLGRPYVVAVDVPSGLGVDDGAGTGPCWTPTSR